jgi:hypothetical protein
MRRQSPQIAVPPAYRACLFGAEVQNYPAQLGSGQQYIIASPGEPLKDGDGCLGDTTTDPVGGTFDQE